MPVTVQIGAITTMGVGLADYRRKLSRYLPLAHILDYLPFLLEGNPFEFECDGIQAHLRFATDRGVHQGKSTSG